MNNEIAIRVVNLSKKYTISGSHERISLSEGLKQVLKRSHIHKEEFYALRNISFEIKKGETVGIIGPNGAGKSTLLKILSRVTEPSEGRVEIYGSVASVLEVGMGFHPELSGRENVYLSATLLGIPQKQIEARFDEIVAFAGVQKFIDTPVKHYSSGMYVRLAFSVVANIDADILIFDEVLSMGDMAFQMKSLKKIKELAGSKKTILLVSHNLNDIQYLCNLAIYLENGSISEFGKLQVLHKYFNKSLDDLGIEDKNGITKVFSNVAYREWKLNSEIAGNEKIQIHKLYVNNEDDSDDAFLSSDKLNIVIEYEKTDNSTDFDLCLFFSAYGNFFFSTILSFSQLKKETYCSKGNHTIVYTFDPNFFNEATISCGLSLVGFNKEIIWANNEVLKFKVRINENRTEYLRHFHNIVCPIMTGENWGIIS